MPFLTDTLHLVALPDPRRFLLAEPLVYAGQYETWTVPAGFSTDLASVPDSLTWLAPRYGTYTRAAVLHDYLCLRVRTERLPQADADGVFRRVLRELGVSGPRRWLMWAAVRAGSHLSGATPADVARFTGIAFLAIPFLLLPTALVTLWQRAFRLLE